MRAPKGNIFQLSIIELFVIILFIGLSYSFIKINETLVSLDDQSLEMENHFKSNDELISQLYNRITVLSDSLEVSYKQLNQQLDENDVDDIGSGIGSCWKRGASSISMLHITIFDNKINVRGIWPQDYDWASKRILGSDLSNGLIRGYTYSRNDFLTTFQKIRAAGQSSSPPCYFVSDLVDSTTTKQDFFRMENAVNQIFVANRKYLYR